MPRPKAVNKKGNNLPHLQHLTNLPDDNEEENRDYADSLEEEGEIEEMDESIYEPSQNAFTQIKNDSHSSFSSSGSCEKGENSANF